MEHPNHRRVPQANVSHEAVAGDGSKPLVVRRMESTTNLWTTKVSTPNCRRFLTSTRHSAQSARTSQLRQVSAMFIVSTSPATSSFILNYSRYIRTISKRRSIQEGQACVSRLPRRLRLHETGKQGCHLLQALSVNHDTDLQ